MNPLLALALLTVLVYGPSLSASFCYEDFNWLSGVLTPVSLAPRLSLAHWTLSLNAFLGGANPIGYHAVNVAWHIGNGLLVYLLVRRVSSHGAAVFGAGVFLLHPIQSEAVAYVSGRMELVGASGVLLACLMPWPLAVTAGLLAMGSKASAIVVVALAPIARVAYGGEWKKTTLGLSIGGVLVIVLAFWPLLSFAQVDPYLSASPDSPLLYAARQSLAIWQLAGLAVLPVGLTVDHDIPAVSMALTVLAPFGLIAMAVLAYRARNAVPVAWLLVLWVLVAFAPRFVMRIPEYVHEHHAYVPLIGLAMSLGLFTKEFER